MLKKVSIQISPEASAALLPLREEDAIVAWNLVYNQDGSTMLVLQHPSAITLAGPLRIPFILTAITSLWAGFYIGRKVHAKGVK